MSKAAAIKLAKDLRAQGKVATVLRTAGVYTQPGRGIVAFVTYSVREG